jgi:hypothetical protein
MVSDALGGVEQLNYSPMSIDSKKEEELFRSIMTQTPSPTHMETTELEPPGNNQSGPWTIEEEIEERKEEEEEEEEDEELRQLLRQGDSTVSSLVLQRREKWSKEKLRKWINQRKKKKLAEFAELRGSKNTRLRPQQSPKALIHSPGSMKV